MKTRTIFWLPIFFVFAACGPQETPPLMDEPTGAAAPDMTPATTPPSVPVPPGGAEPFDATSRTDIGAVVPDTIDR